MKMKFSKEIYAKTVLFKAAYAFTDKAYMNLDADNSDYIVCIEMKPGKEHISEKEFINEMLHQAVRFDIYTKTKVIRELLMARAMASTVIENPIANETIPDSEPIDIDLILTDWFEQHDKYISE